MNRYGSIILSGKGPEISRKLQEMAMRETSSQRMEKPATEQTATPQITSLTVLPQNAPLAFQDIDCSRDDYLHGISGGRLS